MNGSQKLMTASLLSVLSLQPVYGELKDHLSVLQSHSTSSSDKFVLLQTMAREPNSSAPDSEVALQQLAYEAITLRNKEAIYELAYVMNGFNQLVRQDKETAYKILSPLLHEEDEFAKALAGCIQKRTVVKAESLLNIAQTPRQKALAFLVLAEASFAKNDVAKAMLYSVLSLGTYPSKIHDQQAQFYMNEAIGTKISFLQTRETLLEQLNVAMENTMSAQKFRTLFETASVVGLLPSWPLQVRETIKQEPLNITLSFDENYVPHAGVVILSAILSADPSSRYKFNIMEDEESPLQASSKAKLEKLADLFGDDRFEVEFVKITTASLPNVVSHMNFSKAWPRLVFFKLLIPNVFEKDSRQLWLDSDVIVRSDLTDFYNQDFQDAWFVGTRDVRADGHLARLQKPKTNKYYNCGVLLFNNEALRDADSVAIIEEALTSFPELAQTFKMPEQDLIATLYQDHLKENGVQKVMPDDETESTSIWNWFAQEHPSTTCANIHSHFSGIIHMESGDIKPWKQKWSLLKWNRMPKKNNGIENLYWALRDMGPWPVNQKG